MKILVVTHKPSYPKIDGGCVASAQIILGLENLRMNYQIATISTPKHPFQLSAFPSEIREKIALYFEIDTSNPLRNLQARFSSKRAIFLERFFDTKFEKLLVDFCQKYKPDVIHFESLFSAIYLPALKKVSKAKMILRSHNVEHQLWEDRLKTSNFLKIWLLKKEVEQLKKEEIDILKAVDGIAAISKNELDFLHRNNITTPCVHLPTGMALPNRESRHSNDFFHLAAMDWQPNIRGLNWFLKEVWSKSNWHKKNLLHIAGKNLLEEDFKDIQGVKNHGSVNDSSEFMCDFGIMLAPLFEGSGLRIKIIEAGFLAVPIIATQKAVEGIGLENGKHYLEANTATDFQNAMQLLMNDVSLRRNLGVAIRAFMQQNFNQEELNHRLIEFYKSI